jgi:hypothetical protein
MHSGQAITKLTCLIEEYELLAMTTTRLDWKMQSSSTTKSCAKVVNLLLLEPDLEEALQYKQTACHEI